MTTAEEYMASPEFQERQARDSGLVRRIQDGFALEEPNEENPHPLVTDGTFTEDASSALGELYQCYEPLIHKISKDTYAKLNQPSGADVADIKQEGFYGLMRAALNWNPETARGGFLSYARIAIKNHTMRKAREVSTTVYVPHGARDMIGRYRNAYWISYADDGHLPHRERIASWMGVSVETVHQAAKDEALALQMGSIDNGYFEDDRDQHSTYGTRESRWMPIDPDAHEMRSVEDDIILGAIQNVVRETFQGTEDSDLRERELLVLRLRFFGEKGIGEPMTLEEVSKVLGVTRERVRQIEMKTLARLRHPQRRAKLEGFLGETAG